MITSNTLFFRTSSNAKAKSPSISHASTHVVPKGRIANQMTWQCSSVFEYAPIRTRVTSGYRTAASVFAAGLSHLIIREARRWKVRPAARTARVTRDRSAEEAFKYSSMKSKVWMINLFQYVYRKTKLNWCAFITRKLSKSPLIWMKYINRMILGLKESE